MVICIGREFGSGGHDVGKILAEKLNIPYYDKKLIDSTEGIGLKREELEKADEKRSSSIFPVPQYGITERRLSGMTINDIVYQLQCEWISEEAAKEDCVVVGRCADRVLDAIGIPYISIFISGTLEFRVEREMNDHGYSEKEAMNIVTKADKHRRQYYNYYTDCTWGAPSNYDICISTSTYGIEGAADILYNMIKDDFRNPDSAYVKRSKR